jgi:hypothetical protein
MRPRAPEENFSWSPAGERPPSRYSLVVGLLAPVLGLTLGVMAAVVIANSPWEGASLSPARLRPQPSSHFPQVLAPVKAPSAPDWKEMPVVVLNPTAVKTPDPSSVEPPALRPVAPTEEALSREPSSEPSSVALAATGDALSPENSSRSPAKTGMTINPHGQGQSDDIAEPPAPRAIAPTEKAQRNPPRDYRALRLQMLRATEGARGF